MDRKVTPETVEEGFQLLTTAAEIRQWAEARSGLPAIEDRPPGIPGVPVLRILFDQEGLNTGEAQYIDRPGGLDMVTWDEWVAELRKRKQALKVAAEVPGILDDRFEFVDLDEPEA